MARGWSEGKRFCFSRSCSLVGFEMLSSVVKYCLEPIVSSSDDIGPQYVCSKQVVVTVTVPWDFQCGGES